MKKVLRGLPLAVIAVSLVFVTVSCGGNNPKALAKQVYVLIEEAQKLEESGVTSGPRYDALFKKQNQIEARFDKLSEEELEVFYSELGRLFGETQ